MGRIGLYSPSNRKDMTMHNHEDRQLNGTGFEPGAEAKAVSGAGMGAAVPEADESVALLAAPVTPDLRDESSDGGALGYGDASGHDKPPRTTAPPYSTVPADEPSHDTKARETPIGWRPTVDARAAQGLTFVMAVSSERGARLGNEDSAWYGDGIACVSDGIGGAPFGDVMAKLCCGAFGEAWRSALGAVGDAAERWRLGEWCMYQAFASVDAFVSKASSCLGEGSGATLVAVAACGGELVFGRMGDSTAYILCDDGELAHVFGDDHGRSSSAGNALRTAMGYHVLQNSGQTSLQTARVPMRDGMKVLLCSDGVWDQLSATRLAELLSRTDDPRTAARGIVLEATEAGGDRSDNATAVVICVRRNEELGRQQTPCIAAW